MSPFPFSPRLKFPPTFSLSSPFSVSPPARPWVRTFFLCPYPLASFSAPRVWRSHAIPPVFFFLSGLSPSSKVPVAFCALQFDVVKQSSPLILSPLPRVVVDFPGDFLPETWRLSSVGFHGFPTNLPLFKVSRRRDTHSLLPLLPYVWPPLRYSLPSPNQKVLSMSPNVDFFEFTPLFSSPGFIGFHFQGSVCFSFGFCNLPFFVVHWRGRTASFFSFAGTVFFLPKLIFPARDRSASLTARGAPPSDLDSPQSFPRPASALFFWLWQLTPESVFGHGPVFFYILTPFQLGI